MFNYKSWQPHHAPQRRWLKAILLWWYICFISSSMGPLRALIYDYGKINFGITLHQKLLKGLIYSITLYFSLLCVIFCLFMWFLWWMMYCFVLLFNAFFFALCCVLHSWVSRGKLIYTPSTQFSRHCVLNSETQHRALYRAKK